MIGSDLCKTNSYIKIKGESYRLKEKIRAGLASEKIILKAKQEGEPEQKEGELKTRLEWAKLIVELANL